MNYILSAAAVQLEGNLALSGSKSETNRALLLQALYPLVTLTNGSNSDDSMYMQRALQTVRDSKQNTASSPEEFQLVDIHHAGTAMRFLTAYFAATPGTKVLLTGSSRMQERPISILVDALRALGADIAYAGNDGFPPLKITGKLLSGRQVQLDAQVSSQYISALLLVGNSTKNGLELTLNGQITSLPYIEMTRSLLAQVGIDSVLNGQTLSIASNQVVKPQELVVESDWSSASYFYSIIALSPVGSTLTLSSFKAESLQADAILARVYEAFGVQSHLSSHQLTLTKISEPTITHFDFDFTHAPDIAQTVAVSCYGLHITCDFTGLHTLKIKETDRLVALQTELTKFGAVVEITHNSFHLKSCSRDFVYHSDVVAVDTYQDHRMAMAFAPLAILSPIQINDADVVTKSYVDFWNHLSEIGFLVK